ncbi:RsmD family RNA methyltransferase [Porphyromonas gingivalis]|uniref:RsmD family RNA methyltransferase n=1 Tax=Porphyromonas gingivalis TaxID=837 RepID=UPI001F44557E|nr:RsmD family RNA methyltransferase [Porphyromonas gingivalis]MCE8181003.1 RsmD family RNA methyltransferase [Porphyromonas gingivalis]
MRVIRGKYGHRRFDVPKSFNARPTTDFAKENLFNILSNRFDFEGFSAIDLFSGTGSIALELVSRGCSSVTSIEKRREHAAFIRNLIKHLNEENCWRIFETDVFLFLERNKACHRYDLVFADPPYALTELEQLPTKVLESNILAEGGLFILEHPKDFSFTEHPRFEEHRAYGSVNFTFFR